MMDDPARGVGAAGRIRFAVKRGGVRADDGMVVFAVRADEVVRDAEGSRCLLWQAPYDGTDSPAQRERLQHCRLALLHRSAEARTARRALPRAPFGARAAMRK